MHENTTILELYKKNAFINCCYERMAKELNISYTRLLCDCGANANAPVDIADLIINVAEFENILNKFE